MRTSCLLLSFLLLSTLAACAGRRTRDAVPEAVVETALARQALVEHDLDEALDHLGRAQKVARPRDEAPIWLLLAEVRLAQDRPDEALSLSDRVLDGDPEHPGAQFVAAKALFRQNRFEAAAARFDRVGMADLARLARGLHAYADADLHAAERHWQEIDDDALDDMLQAAREAQVASPAGFTP